MYNFGNGRPHLKFLLILAMANLLVINASYAQTGGRLVIGSGAIITSVNDLSVQSGTTLDVQGTLILKKNLLNENSSSNSLGNGLIEFAGSEAQSIKGLNIIENLRINNSAGLTIAGETRVNGELKFKAGIITLGSNNLLLGPAAVDSGGSAASMVDAGGTGEFRKEFPSSPGFPLSFTYPVGDATGTPEYSPVSLTFASGTFGSGNYAGVKLVNDKYPNDSITGSYLKRYWTLGQAAITSFSCNASFRYLTADVTGTEGSLFCTRVDPSPLITYNATNTGTHQLAANGLTSFSTFTGSRGGFDANLTAFLEGPYNSGTGNMNTTLKTSGLIPLSQPYNVSPWNYAGPESVAGIPNDVVDWVLIEYRQADIASNATSATVLKRRAAFLKQDGSIVETDGSSAVRVYNSAISSNLFPVIIHRNHLAIMANSGVAKDGTGKYVYNFSSGADQIFGSGKKQLGSLWCMITADANGDGTIQTIDKTMWVSQFNQDGYLGADFNLDGTVQTSDKTKWVLNFNIDSTVP
ncbi:MAG: hypothetical protein WCK92_07785 [Bacteroidota bacterium]